MSRPSPVFATTRWTLVIRASGTSPEARAALGELCEAYWEPVFRFLRREGRSEDQATELTQEFFARLLRKDALGTATPERGRFRSYLLGALRHFLADQADHQRRLKRGGGQAPDSIDALEDAGAAPAGLTAGPPDDEGFDYEWALRVMDRALSRVEEEFGAADRAETFAVLKGWLAGDESPLPQAEAARRLGLTEGAVKVAIHRLRRRFREMVRSELADTLPEGADPTEELRYLVGVLSRFQAGSRPA